MLGPSGGVLADISVSDGPGVWLLCAFAKRSQLLLEVYHD